jgi:hypothetical protein
MSRDAADPDARPLAEGWEDDDVRMLQQLAQFGMQTAQVLTRQLTAHDEACQAGETQPLSRAEAAKAALDFARVSRAVRQTLGLKAIARGATFPVRPVSARAPHAASPFEDPDDPDDWDDADEADDLQTAIADCAADVRLRLEHAIAAPERPDIEIEALREMLELALSREAADPRIMLRDANGLVERICRDLGVPCDWIAALSADGQFHSWIVGRPGNGGAPHVWPDAGPQHAQFLTPWTRPTAGAHPPSEDAAQPRPPDDS